jgi:hypothetical protein
VVSTLSCHFLERSNIGAALQQMRRKRVPQHMRRHPLVEPGALRRPADVVLKRAVDDMMPPPQTRRRIDALFARREDPLPGPAFARAGVFSFEPFRRLVIDALSRPEDKEALTRR